MQKYTKRELEMYKTERKWRGKKPYRAFIFIDWACNNDCIHCFVGDKSKRERPKMDELKAFIDEVAKFKPVLNIGGGEPTISPRLFEVIEYGVSKGLDIKLFTNGRTFISKEFAKKVRKNVEMIVVPFHSHDSSVFDKVTKRKGSFDQTVKGLKIMKELEFDIQNMLIVHRWNYKNILQTCRFLCEEVGPNTITFESLVIAGNAVKSPTVIRLDEMAEDMQKAMEYMHNRGQAFKVTSFPLCLFDKKYWRYFSPNMRTLDMACNFVFKTKRVYIRSGLALGDVCKSCDVQEWCIGSWETYYSIFDDKKWRPVRLHQRN